MKPLLIAMSLIMINLKFVCAVDLAQTPRIVNSKNYLNDPAIIKLNNDKNSTCTGSVVGLNPPTVITAKHCIETDIKQYKNITPELVIINYFPGHPFIMKAGLMPGDMAILIFNKNTKSYFQDINEKDLFIINEEVTIDQFDEIEFCGYGSKSPFLNVRENVGLLSCGKNKIIKKTSDLDFNDELNEFYSKNKRLNFEQFPYPFKEKLIHNLIQMNLRDYGNDAQYGVGALTFANFDVFPIGQFDEEKLQSIMAPGDSGGPMFIRNKQRKILLGVNSSVFDIRYNILGGIFWNVNHPWSIELINKAISNGADIKR